MRRGLSFAAGLLAGLWLDTARRSRRAEREHPPAGSFVKTGLEAGGTTLHYLERGPAGGAARGRPLVFLHGNGIIAEDWELCGVLDRAAERWHCVAFDRPGHGYSEKPRGGHSPSGQAAILRAGARALGLDRPILVGHSLGSTVAAAWALDYPREVGGLVLMSGYSYPTVRPDFVPFMAPAIPIAGQILSRTLAQPIDRLILPALLRRVFEPNPVPASYRRIPPDLLLRPTQLEAAAAHTAALIPGAAALAPRYGVIRCPTAILAGEEDRIVDPLDHAARLHRDIPGSSFHLLAGAGHMIHHARPDAVLDAIAGIVRAADAWEAAGATVSGTREDFHARLGA